MSTCELEKALEQYEKDYSINLMLLNKCDNLITKWITSPNEYILITNSTKKQGYKQLTCFNNNVPCYDLQRKTNEELAHELTILEARIEIINYIF